MKELYDLQFQELKMVIKPYKKYWNEWTQSKDCFLELEEVIAVNKFLNTRSYKAGSPDKEPVEIMHYIIVKNAITKLKLFVDIFTKYKQARQQTQKVRISH